MNKILLVFEIHTDHLISVRQPKHVIVNKKKRTCQIVDFTVLADHRVKLKKSEKRDKCLDLAREMKELGSIKVTEILIIIGALGIVTKGTGTEGLENKRTSGDYTSYSIVEIGEKPWGDLSLRLSGKQSANADVKKISLWVK